jgi:hypothetical protein
VAVINEIRAIVSIDPTRSMTVTAFAIVRAICRLDKRWLLAICLLMILNANFLMIMFFKVDEVDSRNTMNILFPSAIMESNTIKSHDFAHEDGFLTQLPSFTADRREMILGALIERSSTSPHLSLTILALNRNIVIKECTGSCPSRLNANAEMLWSEMRNTDEDEYTPQGKRQISNLFCKISNSKGLVAYVVPAEFVANNYSSEVSANGRIDVFRCMMKNTLHAYDSLVRSDQSVTVSLHRKVTGDMGGGDVITSLLNFTVPWSVRRSGYMMDVFQASTGKDVEMVSSRFNGWEGYRDRRQETGLRSVGSIPNDSFAYTKAERGDDGSAVYLCVTLSVDPLFAPMVGAAAAPSVGNVAQLLEFVQHHLLLGIRHIFVAVRYAPGSDNMRTLLLTLREFIEAGCVTVSTQAGDGIDRTASLFGMGFTSEFLALYHRTTCLFLLKGTGYSPGRENGVGVEAFLAMWGLDSMIVPPDGHSSIQHTLSTATTNRASATAGVSAFQLRGGRGRSAAGARPCHMVVPSVKIVERYPGGVIDTARPWLRDRFPVGDSFVLEVVASGGDGGGGGYMLHEGEEVVPDLVTSLSVQQDVGLIVAVDRVLQPAVPRHGHCVSHGTHEATSYHKNMMESWFKSEYSGSGSSDVDGVIEEVLSAAVLYRYMAKTFRYDRDKNYPELTSNDLGEYVYLFSEKVMSKLRERNLDIMVMVLLMEQTVLKGVEEEHWPKYGPKSLLY